MDRIIATIKRRIGLVSHWLECNVGDHYYENATLHNTQFVGRVPLRRDTLETVLENNGFEESPYSTEVEGAWRRTGPDTRDNHQVHAILYDGDAIERRGDSGYTYVYAHSEIRWDLHPWKHFRGLGFDPDVGRQRMKVLFDEVGVNCEPIRP